MKLESFDGVYRAPIKVKNITLHGKITSGYKVFVCNGEGEDLDDFSIFAIIIGVYKNGVAIQRFQKFGDLCIGSIFLNNKEFGEYYREVLDD